MAASLNLDVNKYPGIESEAVKKSWREMRRRLNGPQRHRLLQGYPQPQFMVTNREGIDEVAVLDVDRKLIVGVLPHSFCNPQIQGCGFCTFPHERYDREAASATVASVCAEIRARSLALRVPERRVDALYFGGGTANLIQPSDFTMLANTLAETFDLSSAELSFEGVPIYFLVRNQALLDVFEAMPGRHRRLSLGVQSFDRARLTQMGRQAYGSKEDIARLVQSAHSRGMTISCDLLINLPGQTRAEIEATIRTAIDLGFDQICVYHLVLFRGLGTPWASDEDKLEALPDNEQAFQHWLAATNLLERAGFVQQSLTNFEKRDLAESDRRFLYEELSYRPEMTDAVGFGPSAITTFSDNSRAVKIINQSNARAYRDSISLSEHAVERRFDYEPEDMKLLFLTRSLARTRVDKELYSNLFGSEVMHDFGAEIAAASEFDLVKKTQTELKLTSRGSFFADTVAGTLAWSRVQKLRERGLGPVGPRRLPLTEAGKISMG